MASLINELKTRSGDWYKSLLRIGNKDGQGWSEDEMNEEINEEMNEEINDDSPKRETKQKVKKNEEKFMG